jgi:translation initiation factor eIF-2B subunit beta
MVVPDSAVFAIMSRVNKVVLSTHSVLINGGLIADSGTGLVANAARVHKIPTVVLCSVYKLSPIYPFDPDSLVEYGDPAVVLGSNDLDLVGKIDVSNSLTEYVSPDLVDLYITNL